MKPTVAIVAPSNDTRVGGVERFANLLSDALAPDFAPIIIEATSTRPRRPAVAGWVRSARATGKSFDRRPRPDLVITGVTLGYRIDRTIPRIHVCHGTMVENARAEVGESAKARVSTAVGGGVAEFLSTRHANLVAVSRTTAAELKQNYRLHKPVTVLENGVDVAMFRPMPRDACREALGWPKEKAIALFVGRPELRKGIDVAVHASALAGYSLYLAGSRPHEGAEWLGLLSPQTLALAYNAADCVLFPTRYEACSYTILEAAACGAPLLTSAVGWMNDIVEANPDLRDLVARPELDEMAKRLISMRRSTPPADLRNRLRAIVVESNSTSAFGERWRSHVAQVLNASETEKMA